MFGDISKQHMLSEYSYLPSALLYIIRGLETLANWVIIISGEGFVLLGTKPLPEPVAVISWILKNEFRY